MLEARDGNRFAAFLATPEEPSQTGVVILPDVRGLYRFYEELALRFAERGHTALAFDYFGRTAGVEKRDEDFEYPPHVEADDVPRGSRRMLPPPSSTCASLGCDHDLHGRLLHGRPRSPGSPPPAATGSRARSASTGGRGSRRTAQPGPTQLAGADRGAGAGAAGRRRRRTSRPSDNEAFDRALTEAGVEHEVVTYDGAPHSFFDRKQEEFAAASDDAWGRVLEFVQRYSRAA